MRRMHLSFLESSILLHITYNLLFKCQVSSQGLLNKIKSGPSNFKRFLHSVLHPGGMSTGGSQKENNKQGMLKALPER